MEHDDVLVILLAGGAGERLEQLADLVVDVGRRADHTSIS